MTHTGREISGGYMRIFVGLLLYLIAFGTAEAQAPAPKQCTYTDLAVKSQIPGTSRDNLLQMRKLASSVEEVAMVAIQKFNGHPACIKLLIEAIDMRNAAERELTRQRDKRP